MQVNMGEGKSSVILPICAATLADGTRLVRVIAPKALIPQTLQFLTDRLCGLVHRPVYHLRWSRGGEQSKVECLQKLVTLKDGCGLIVMQPEDVLSLKLDCVEAQLIENGISIPIPEKRGMEHVLHVLQGSLLKSVSTDNDEKGPSNDRRLANS